MGTHGAEQTPGMFAWMDKIEAGTTNAVPRWAPGTAYATGQQVVSPNNDVVSANAAHTSTAVFDPTKWSGSSTYARVVRGSLVSQMATDGTDQSATWNTELAALNTAGGGTYYLPVGTIRIDPQTTMPHDNSPIWKQAPITIVGGGQRQNGSWAGLETALGGTVLDLRYAGADAKILTLGQGLLRFKDITFAENGTSTTPFILTTNTTVKTKDCAAIGNPSKSGQTCDQDWIVFGGTTNVIGNLVTSAFQGYGSKCEGTRFSRIRRGFYGRTFCNAVILNDNVWGGDCGGQTAVEFDGTAGQSAANNGTGNIIEMTGYTYGMTFTNSTSNTFYGTSFWDHGGSAIADIRLVGSGSNGNEFPGTFGGTVENTTGLTYTITGGGVTDGSPISNRLAVRGVRASGGGFGDDFLITLSRSWAEALEPNGRVFTATDKGTAYLNAPTGMNPALYVVHKTAGQLTVGHDSLVRDSGTLAIYAGSGASDRVWIARGCLVISSGTTANRPTVAGWSGLHYFDTTLGKPIWTNGAGVWVDATGTAV